MVLRRWVVLVVRMRLSLWYSLRLGLLRPMVFAFELVFELLEHIRVCVGIRDRLETVKQGPRFETTDSS